MSSNDRQPAGTPSGGRFAPQAHAEVDISLDLPTDDKATGNSTAGVVVPDLYLLNDSLSVIASESDIELSDEALNGITHRLAADLESAQKSAIAESNAETATRALGVQVRSTEDVLYGPLSPTEIALRVDDDDFIEVYLAVDVADLTNSDLESHLDSLAERVCGSESGMLEIEAVPVRVDHGCVICRVSGDVTPAVKGWAGDGGEEWDQYSLGAEYRATSG